MGKRTSYMWICFLFMFIFLYVVTMIIDRRIIIDMSSLNQFNWVFLTLPITYINNDITMN